MYSIDVLLFIPGVNDVLCPRIFSFILVNIDFGIMSHTCSRFMKFVKTACVVK